MGTAVLHPQDCLNLSRSREPQIAPSFKHNRNPRSARRRKRSPSSSDGESNTVVKSPARNLVLGQVKILKRGEKLETTDGGKILKREERSKVDSRKSDVLSEYPKMPKRREMKQRANGMSKSTSGPEPNTIPREIVEIAERFAGCAFVDCPHPSSVPVPLFLKKVMCT